MCVDECSVNFRVLKLAAGCVVALVTTWWQQFATGGDSQFQQKRTINIPQALDRFCLTSTFGEGIPIFF